MVGNKAAYRLSILLLTALIIIISTAAQVSAFAYSVNVLNNTITKEETAYFELIISNTADYDDYFTISTRDVNWVLNIDPQSSYINAHGEMKFLLEFNPKLTVDEMKTYFIPVKIKSEKTGFYYEEREKFAIYVVSPDLGPGEYIPTVTPVISIDNAIDPRQKVSVLLILKNRNPRELDNIKVVLNGEIFSKEYTTKLLPLEEKTNEVLFSVDPLTKPGTKTLTLQLYYNDKNVAEASAEFDVQGYSDLKEKSSKNTFLFRTEERFTIYNNGNQPATAEKSFSVNLIKRLFTKFTPDAVKEKGLDGKSYYVIRQTLDPQETLAGSMVTDYRMLVLVIILLILAVIFYYVWRSPIVIMKNAEPMGQTKDGLSEVKVRLYLKNRARKPVHNLRVIDFVPHIAEIDRTTHLGSMEPVSIGKGKRGTVPRWEMDALEPYEERIISYRVKSKLTLIGGIRLPDAKVTFDTGKGKERTIYSNSVNLTYKTE
jgi:hypothetical protein